jgi:hypothetical protein
MACSSETTVTPDSGRFGSSWFISFLSGGLVEPMLQKPAPGAA